MRIKKKELSKIFNEAKERGEFTYYNFDDFIKDVYRLKKDIEKQNVVVHIDVSRSGMTRRFNFADGYNMPINILYNNKVSWKPVSVRGCGEDMGWSVLFSSLSVAFSGIDKSKLNYNLLCSKYKTI